ncbi:hypothetical protein A2690_00365 [Candidatus Roizmanbacteria bacterium RIFCSPHIGHO2_01_FULL_39_12b]|uniref:YprB ribonuclease H-like domain-containing protein n=1 Tax=Candidatus Roizmanbacteria bacterium RIFCSPHIGHO2_01_FULL_39_12b TaxID=1802030 RepID=A0A1F7G8H3_9BACT|nr:MAG: hypothetical protein A2690_00365 [Candidatus Roizmanbacteria bacterium RIFCSPHIGHO2_01_FULL_39_12b]OGK46020.1 MAG: hypothetical protein A3B46_00655 [Candidatus Roizmanbacteria bacterium RIFCSPLOWO2_01_FULL_39_19]
MRLPLVIDLETKYTFRQYSDPKQLRITVVGAYDYATDTSHTFLEEELGELYSLMEKASYIVGFNIVGFDLPVLSAYYPGDVKQFKTLDLLDDIRNKLGRRLSLDMLLKATLGKQKTGHGLQAVEFYKEGKIEELKSYCLHDVLFTKDLFEYGCEHATVYFLEGVAKTAVPVSWKTYRRPLEEQHDISLTLPF